MDSKFSIIIPVFNKEDTIGRAIQSLISQRYPNELYEIIIIDDGSTDNSREVIKTFMKHKFVRAFFLKDNKGRLNARNIGMELSNNDWICWLDADDEYMSNYLETYNDYIKMNQEYKLFNSGMLVKDRILLEGLRLENGWRIVEPLYIEEKDKGMKHFPKGKIGTGSFVFHRSIMFSFPNGVESADGGDKSFPAKLVEFDEKFQGICEINDKGQWLPLGNPWGDDYCYFWYLTRFYKSRMINALLYIQHIRK